MIIRLEEISMNAWPALQTIIYDGWIGTDAKTYKEFHKRNIFSFNIEMTNFKRSLQFE